MQALSPVTATAGMQRNFTVFPITPGPVYLSCKRSVGHPEKHGKVYGMTWDFVNTGNAPTQG